MLVLEIRASTKLDSGVQFCQTISQHTHLLLPLLGQVDLLEQMLRHLGQMHLGQVLWHLRQILSKQQKGQKGQKHQLDPDPEVDHLVALVLVKDHSALGPSPCDLQVTRTSLRLVCCPWWVDRWGSDRWPAFGGRWQCWRWRWRFGLFDRSIDSCGRC